MRHPSERASLIPQILSGDGCLSQPHGPGCKLVVGEDGMLSMVSVIAVLGFVVLIAFVANVGVEVNEKIELQNAADATAYSSALWQSRALNAVTTANHLMGELTALTVVLDAFGGKMLSNDYGGSYRSAKSRYWNEQLDKVSHAYAKHAAGGRVMMEFDKPLVEEVVKMLTEDSGSHEAGATIYDAKLTLKYSAYVALLVKKMANQILAVAEVAEESGILAWAGALLELVALPMHATMSKYLADIGVEWAYLEATRTAVSLVTEEGALRDGIRQAVVPAISLYADTVVGSSATARLAEGGAPFNVSVRDTQRQLARLHELSTADTWPAWDDMELPLVKEAPPVASERSGRSAAPHLGAWDFPQSEWTGDFTSWELRYIQERYRVLRREVEKIRARVEWFTGPLADAAGLVADAADRLGKAFGGGRDNSEMQKAAETLKKIKNLLALFREGLPREPNAHGFKSNPCTSDDLDEQFRLPKFYWKAERKTQWVRATYPYVDQYRAPIIQFFRNRCPLSNAATYYVNWSNRYTLSASFEIRRPQHDQSESKAREKGLLARLRAKVRKLRKEFEEATDDTAEENAGKLSFGKFDAISRELLDVIQEFRGRIPSLEQWFEDVSGHRALAKRVAQGLRVPADSAIPEDTLHGLAEEMALINLLDELLSLLEDFLDSLELGEPHMYVLKGMTPEGKGIDEPWIANEELAERLFVVTAYVSRPPPELFANAVFTGSNRPRYAVASAIVYNANGRNVGASDRPNVQPNTGWDTLNWEPPVHAGEWGDHPPLTRGGGSPWDLLSTRPLARRNRVKLNWQVKLVPITERRMQDILNEVTELRSLGGHRDLVKH